VLCEGTLASQLQGVKQRRSESFGPPAHCQVIAGVSRVKQQGGEQCKAILRKRQLLQRRGRHLDSGHFCSKVT